MSLKRMGHKLAGLVDRERDFRPSNGGILESTNNRSIHKRIIKSRRPKLSELTCGLHRSGNRRGIQHSCPSEEISEILRLSEK
jgi:hypothetical protein